MRKEKVKKFLGLFLAFFADFCYTANGIANLSPGGDRSVKTKTWIALIAAIAAVCLGLSAFLLLPGGDAGYAQISSGGKVVKTVNLCIDQQFTVTGETGGSNTVTVRDGHIAVTEADCPDHYCMERGFCSGGTPIVCLPNRLVIRFLGEQSVDAAAG